MGRKVLLIEDHPDCRESLRQLLALWGHDVAVAPNGTRGITLALARRPDVVLVDLSLPDISGCEVVRRIRAAFASQPLTIIALTGWPDGKHEDEVRAAGCDEYVLKPVEPEALEELLTNGTTRAALHLGATEQNPRLPDDRDPKLHE